MPKPYPFDIILGKVLTTLIVALIAFGLIRNENYLFGAILFGFTAFLVWRFFVRPRKLEPEFIDAYHAANKGIWKIHTLVFTLILAVTVITVLISGDAVIPPVLSWTAPVLAVILSAFFLIKAVRINKQARHNIEERKARKVDAQKSSNDQPTP